MIAKFRTQRLAVSIFSWLLVFVTALLADPAMACPFCGSMQGPSLTGEVDLASLVVFGTLTNARLNAGGDQGSTDLQIDVVIKNHEILGGKKVITLPRYIPTDKNMSKILLFCDVYKGKIDPLRGVPVKADSDIVKYVQGALAVKDKDLSIRLRYYFDNLDNAEMEVSNDAYKEFAVADYKDYRDMAKNLPADKIAKWLQDPATPAYRHGPYASLLGDCGGDKHAEVLLKLLDDCQKQAAAGVDGMLAGYTMIKPKEGWTYIENILKDPKKEFMLRYAALRTIRFFWKYRPDLVPDKDLVEGVKILLEQGDIADMAIEDLRLHRCWEAAAQILKLYGRKSHDVPIIRRYIVRYALSCPKKEAKEFVTMMRQKDPEMVKDIEEFLKLETPAPNPPTVSQPTAKPVAGK